MTGATVVAGVAAMLGAYGIGDVVDLLGARRRRRGGRGRRGGVVGLLSLLGGRVAARPPAALGRRIEAAGLRVSVQDVMAVKAGAVPVGLLLGLALLDAAPGRLGPVVVLAAPAAGFVAPDVWLLRRARRRGLAMAAELADVLELLRVAVGAGLGPRRALAEVGRRHPGVLAAELRAVADRAELGMPFAAALAGLERRAPAPGVPALVAALVRAERLGAPPGPALAALCADARAREAKRAAERAAKAAPKIQLVIALLLVPSALLLVAAALVPAVGLL
jgi:tight adherence protein C